MLVLSASRPAISPPAISDGSLILMMGAAKVILPSARTWEPSLKPCDAPSKVMLSVPLNVMSLSS